MTRKQHQCRATYERTAFETQQDKWDMQREHWDAEVRMLVPGVSDADLQKYWEWDIDPTDAADHITGDYKLVDGAA
jgi:hypothetical protein